MIPAPAAGRAYSAASSFASGKMILFTKKKMSMETPPFNTVVPVYTSTKKIPKYLSNTTMEVSTDSFYWNSRLIGALVDPHFGTAVQLIERYQMAVPSKGHALINEYDAKMIEEKDF